MKLYDGDYRVSTEAHNEIAARPSWDADAFAMAYVRAQGCEHPEYEKRRLRRYKAEFIAWFGHPRIAQLDYDRWHEERRARGEEPDPPTS